MRTIVLGWIGSDPCYQNLYGKALACVWLYEGTSRDLRKARDYAKTVNIPDVRVFVYPTTEPKPIERTREALATKRDA